MKKEKKTDQPKDLIEIGYIAKAHGIKGELFLKLFDEDSDGWFLKTEELFLGDEAYNVLKSRRHQNGYIIILKGVLDRNKAELLKGRTALLNQSFFAENSDQDNYFLNQIKGFKVFLNSVDKGKVVGFSSTQAHEIIVVKTDLGEFEIPWVKDFIKDIDFKNNALNLDCPKELFEIDFGLSDKND